MNTFRLPVCLAIFFFLTLWSYSAVAAETPKRGNLVGGAVHVAPAWFKESFLDIADDVEEATENNKHVMLFFQLNGCPYCDRMLTEIFDSDRYKDYIQKHFDVIAINVRGDRDIAFNKEVSLTEKELSEMLKVWATPGIVFLNSKNKQVIRVNGYRSPARFFHIMEFVSSNAYKTQKLASYLDQHLDRGVYKFQANPMFKDIADLSSVKGPLALIFEDSSCNDCKEFHNKLLAYPDVQKEMSRFTVVRLDAESNATIMDVGGKNTTPKKLAESLSMTYRPGVVLYADGKQLRRYDSLMFRHHFKEGLRWIGSGAYKTENYKKYSNRRTEELLSSGVDIDLGS